jgi:hypothetical protein
VIVFCSLNGPPARSEFALLSLLTRSAAVLAVLSGGGGRSADEGTPSVSIVSMC